MFWTLLNAFFIRILNVATIPECWHFYQICYILVLSSAHACRIVNENQGIYSCLSSIQKWILLMKWSGFIITLFPFNLSLFFFLFLHPQNRMRASSGHTNGRVSQHPVSKFPRRLRQRYVLLLDYSRRGRHERVDGHRQLWYRWL